MPKTPDAIMQKLDPALHENATEILAQMLYEAWAKEYQLRSRVRLYKLDTEKAYSELGPDRIERFVRHDDGKATHNGEKVLTVAQQIEQFVEAQQEALTQAKEDGIETAVTNRFHQIAKEVLEEAKRKAKENGAA